MSITGIYQAIRLGADKRPSNGTVIAQAPSENGRCPAHIDALWKPGEVIIAWTYDAPPRRQLSRESLATVRLKRLRRRLERKAPLFADQLEAEEIARRPAFYAGERMEVPQ